MPHLVRSTATILLRLSGIPTRFASYVPVVWVGGPENFRMPLRDPRAVAVADVRLFNTCMYCTEPALPKVGSPPTLINELKSFRLYFSKLIILLYMLGPGPTTLLELT